MALADQVFGFYMPTINLGGVGSAREAGVQAKLLGASKALIVTDKVLNQLGMAGEIKERIEAAGVQAVIFDGAAPNPTDVNVHDGVNAFQDNGCDAWCRWAAAARTTAPRASVSWWPTAAASATTREWTAVPSRSHRSWPSTPPRARPAR